MLCFRLWNFPWGWLKPPSHVGNTIEVWWLQPTAELSEEQCPSSEFLVQPTKLGTCKTLRIYWWINTGAGGVFKLVVSWDVWIQALIPLLGRTVLLLPHCIEWCNRVCLWDTLYNHFSKSKGLCHMKPGTGAGVKVSPFWYQRGEQGVDVSHALFTMSERTLQQPVHNRIKEGEKAEH